MERPENVDPHSWATIQMHRLEIAASRAKIYCFLPGLEEQDAERIKTLYDRVSAQIEKNKELISGTMNAAVLDRIASETATILAQPFMEDLAKEIHRFFPDS